MAQVYTHADYLRAVNEIKALKVKLWQAAAHRGNLDPEVIAISQAIDAYIVLVQQYWRQHPSETRIG